MPRHDRAVTAAYAGPNDPYAPGAPAGSFDLFDDLYDPDRPPWFDLLLMVSHPHYRPPPELLRGKPDRAPLVARRGLVIALHRGLWWAEAALALHACRLAPVESYKDVDDAYSDWARRWRWEGRAAFASGRFGTWADVERLTRLYDALGRVEPCDIVTAGDLRAPSPPLTSYEAVETFARAFARVSPEERARFLSAPLPPVGRG